MSTAEEEFSDIIQTISLARHLLSHKRNQGETKGNESQTTDGNKRRPWLSGPLPLSCQGCRFELPIDLKVLESLTVIEYLSDYCIISSRRKNLSKTCFLKADGDLDGIINSYELRQALVDLYSNSIDNECLEDILDVIDCQIGSIFNREQFAAVAAFSERYLCSRYHDKQELSSSKQLLEKTDFAGIRAKLEGHKISLKLVRTLLIIAT